MNRGLISKSLREAWPTTLVCGLGIMVFQVLFSFVLRTFEEQALEQWLEMDFIQNMIEAILGSDLGDTIGPGVLRSFAWVHPVVLSLLWAHEITLCTRVPAGEIDRGTIDVLLGLPVSRWGVYLCESVVWMLAGLAIICMGLLGNVIGNSANPGDAGTKPTQLCAVVVNLYCLYLAVGGLALMISSLCDHRGRAVALAFGVVVASFLLNFLAQFWEPARSLSFLGVLNYYKPLVIMRESAWPVKDLLVLTTCAGVLWLAGGLFFARRDICTV